MLTLTGHATIRRFTSKAFEEHMPVSKTTFRDIGQQVSRSLNSGLHRAWTVHHVVREILHLRKQGGQMR